MYQIIYTLVIPLIIKKNIITGFQRYTTEHFQNTQYSKEKELLVFKLLPFTQISQKKKEASTLQFSPY